MTNEGSNDRILSKVNASRRDFVKRVLAGAAFAAPVIATFSIDGLGVDSALAQSNSSGTSHCAIDTGYVGPSHFKAHLSDSTRATRVQAEIQFEIKDEDHNDHNQPRSIQTELEVSNDAVVTASYVAINGINVANFPLKKGQIGVPDVHNVCDFDALLQAMAASQTTVVVQGTFAGQAFTLTGPLVPSHGETIHLNPL